MLPHRRLPPPVHGQYTAVDESSKRLIRKDNHATNLFQRSAWRLPVGWHRFRPFPAPQPQDRHAISTRPLMPQASVIIPAYNAEATLAAAMASAQRQTLADIEILVVDDASTDGTLAVAQRLAAGDLRVSVISGGRNRGPAGARNLGLAVAAGEWIALLDADDAFEPERLARLVPLARQCGADMLADNPLPESGDGGTQPRQRIGRTSWRERGCQTG